MTDISDIAHNAQTSKQLQPHTQYVEPHTYAQPQNGRPPTTRELLQRTYASTVTFANNTGSQYVGGM